MEEHDGWTSVISPPRETMQGVWATEDVVYSGEEEIEMGVLKANSGMLASWMARECRACGESSASKADC